MNNTIPKGKPTSSILIGGVLIALAMAAFFIAYVGYQKSHDFWVTYDLAQIPGLAIKDNSTGTPNELGTPAPTYAPAVAGPTPQPWDGASRVNILVMGLDYRDWESGEGPPRTDTMILLTIDPLTKTGGMLNIPRDLWVSIPGGFDYGKINTAYSLGESHQVPGGGPALAMQTVEALLGVPIDYYAQVDFFAFEQLIDEIGGVEIEVPAEIKVDPIGPGNTVILQPGKQTLDGPVALAYARARYTEGGDFDRAQRQQQVTLAMRDKALSLGVAQLIAKAPDLYTDLAAGIHTNMPLEDAIQLAWLVQDISLENIKRGAIAPPDKVLFAKSPDGTQDILKPIPDKIRQLRDEIFASSNLASPVLGSGDTLEMMKSENARISILNGTYTEGLALQTQEYLQSQGANVVQTGNANEIPNYTKIIDYTGNPYTLRYLVELMKITPYSIFQEYKPDSPVDVEVILGADWAGSNPMP